MATLFKLNPLDSFSPASLPSLAPDADSHFRFQLSTDHEFRLPFIDEPQDGHAFVDPIFRALASLRLGKGEGRTRGRERDAPEGLVEEVRVEARDHVRGVADENSGYSDPQPRILTWDLVQAASGSAAVYTSPFLSEAISDIWEAEAARLPHSATLAASPAYLEPVLVDNVLAVILGMESPLFAWDRERDRFVWRKDRKGKGRQGEPADGRLWGTSIQSSASLVDTFLELGTCLARLEAVVQSLAILTIARTADPVYETSRASHSVASSLSTYLAFVRSSLASLRPSPRPDVLTPLPSLLILSCQIAPLLTNLKSLCTLFERPPSRSPPYTFLPLSTGPLLSRLHDYLSHQIIHSLAPPLLDQTVAAWIWHSAIQNYWRGWEDWVGVRTQGTGQGELWKDVGIQEMKVVRRGQRSLGEEEKDSFEEGAQYFLNMDELPTFLPIGVAMELFEAGRSMRLLRRTKPDHPLCRPRFVEGSGVGVRWSDESIEQYGVEMRRTIVRLRNEVSKWRSGALIRVPSVDRVDSLLIVQPPPSSSTYQVELRPLFSLFDLLPGTTNINAPERSLWTTSDPETDMLAFFASLLAPPSLNILPPPFPSLEILLSRSLYNPLRLFAHLPSTSLLTLFFSDLSLQSHIDVLHSYVLLGNQSFNRRLRESLFAPPEEREGISIRRRRRRDQVAFGEDAGELGEERVRWGAGMGMGIHLNDRSSWPPGGAELSLILRTTLVDSVAEQREAKEAKEARTEKERKRKEGDVRVWQSLESTLSFAVRSGNEDEEKRWSDAQSLNALDFLYLDYKAPAPLSLILTPSILLKYNQIFSHLLRLFRIEAVARSIFTDLTKPNLASTPTGRTSSTTRPYLLDSDPAVKRELQALAFEIQGIVGSLCGFSFENVVQGNFRMFRKALSKIEREATNLERHDSTFDEESDAAGSSWNLDSLVGLHAHSLDRIHEGLLLRPKQAPLLKLVQSQIFGIILLLGRKTKEWRRDEGRSGWDTQVVGGQVREMHDKLRTHASTLVKVLQALDERGTGKTPSSSTAMNGLDVGLEKGSSYISELLVRLDANHWFSQRESRP